MSHSEFGKPRERASYGCAVALTEARLVLGTDSAVRLYP